MQMNKNPKKIFVTIAQIDLSNKKSTRVENAAIISYTVKAVQ